MLIFDHRVKSSFFSTHSISSFRDVFIFFLFWWFWRDVQWSRIKSFVCLFVYLSICLSIRSICVSFFTSCRAFSTLSIEMWFCLVCIHSHLILFISVCIYLSICCSFVCSWFSQEIFSLLHHSYHHSEFFDRHLCWILVRRVIHKRFYLF